MDIKLKLDGYDFSDTPTKTQLENMLDDMAKFLGKIGGALLAKGDFSASEQPLGMLLNCSVSLKATKEAFAGGTQSGLSVPQPQPRIVR